MKTDAIELSMEFHGDLDNADVLPDGTRILYGATITAPKEYAGQVRDLIVWPDGSIHLGQDLTRITNDD